MKDSEKCADDYSVTLKSSENLFVCFFTRVFLAWENSGSSVTSKLFIIVNLKNMNSECYFFNSLKISLRLSATKLQEIKNKKLIICEKKNKNKILKSFLIVASSTEFLDNWEDTLLMMMKIMLKIFGR